MRACVYACVRVDARILCVIQQAADVSRKRIETERVRGARGEFHRQRVNARVLFH
jgi:hypothetical protein